jgi:hypothetical protein
LSHESLTVHTTDYRGHGPPFHPISRVPSDKTIAFTASPGTIPVECPPARMLSLVLFAIETANANGPAE